MNPPAAPHDPGNAWLYFSLLTVITWGIYGIFLAKGRGLISPDGVKDPNGLFKAFLFVGIAYFLVAVLAPIGMLVMNGASWQMRSEGMWWSLLAGIVGAVGAFGVLLAFGARGTPAVVMTIIFAGAPVINAIVGIAMDNAWDKVHLPFYLGLVLAVSGGGLVTFYKPPPAGHGPPKAAAIEPAPAVAPARPKY
jgi:drug/metabolite transporter (DMT)-like permease